MKRLALIAALGGCVGTASAPVDDGPVVPIRFDSAGIEAVGTGQRIDFGRDRAGVRQTMTRLEGGAPVALPCDLSTRTALRWPDGPLLVFRNEAFVGWSTPNAAQSADGRTSYGETCMPLG